MNGLNVLMLIGRYKSISKSDENFDIYNICPSCNKEYNEPPTISRRDNKTYICSNCGIHKALFDFIKKGTLN